MQSEYRMTNEETREILIELWGELKKKSTSVKRKQKCNANDRMNLWTMLSEAHFPKVKE